MANLLRTLRVTGERRFSTDDYAGMVAEAMRLGMGMGNPVTETYDRQDPHARFGGGFDAVVEGAYKRNGIIFACQMARLMVFAEARFQFQAMNNGKPGKLFGTPALSVLETPWPNATTGSLLARMIQDADMAGNAFGRRTSPIAAVDRIERLRPDWTSIVMGSNVDMVTPDVLGYMYCPGGPASTEDPILLSVEEVFHWAPIPDPNAWYRGMSWMTPVLREIRGDSSATDHKLAFFEHAATPNLVIRMDPTVSEDAFKKFQALVDSNHRGALNAWKNLYIGGAVDVDVVGSSFKDMDLRNVQGAGETRIAAAAGVPPIIVGLSEGLASATYSNYAQARRAFADRTIRTLWRTTCAALQTIVAPPRASRLWYDTSDVAFLQEDRKDAAEQRKSDAEVIASLTMAGYEPKSIADAIESDDWTLLKHNGLPSVQQQSGGGPAPAADTAAPADEAKSADPPDLGGGRWDPTPITRARRPDAAA